MVFPFFDLSVLPEAKPPSSQKQPFDFCYIADAQPHKNHTVLLEAWALLAHEGFFPSLALTVEKKDVAQMLSQMPQNTDREITFLGSLSHDQVMSVYERSAALLFPSTTESFGLPLIEAHALGKPIVASECDFVRDVCTPAETFDPQSPLFLARAVKRFLKHENNTLQVLSSAQLIRTLFS